MEGNLLGVQGTYEGLCNKLCLYYFGWKKFYTLNKILTVVFDLDIKGKQL